MAGIRLEFAQFGHFDYFNIYRSLTSTNIEDLGQPIGTSSTMYYEDSTVEPSLSYFYRVGVVRDLVEEFSEEINVKSYNFKESITSLFSSSEKGFAYDFSDLSTMFQDTAGTTPVTAVDQLVARVNDLSGNGNHLIQSTSGSRPILKQDAKGYYLLFDGTNDFMQTSGTVDLSGLLLFTTFASLSKDRSTTEIIFETSTNYNLNAGAMILPFNTSVISFSILGASAPSYTLVDISTTTGGVFTTTSNLALSSNKITTFRKNGVSQTAANRVDSPSVPLTNQTLYVGARAGTGIYLQTKFRALVFVGKTATTTDIERLENLLI